MHGKVLITGGSGFLGQKLAERFRDSWKVVIGSRNEKNLFQVSKSLSIEAFPLDVANEFSVNEAFQRIRPDIVIHAAATKFVDHSEKFPNECIDINVRGSQNVARAAIYFGTRGVLGISTDKVTSPIANLYGLSKAIMERSFLLQNMNETKFACVRYGNVAWSTGSVFPIWARMSEQEKKITSTGPEMYRFFFSVDEAIDLVEIALKRIDSLAGKVLSIPMKGAKISRILDIWSELYKVPWSTTTRRFGDRDHELLISENELSRAREISLEGKSLFELSLSAEFESQNSLKVPYTSISAPQLSDHEISQLILGKPTII